VIKTVLAFLVFFIAGCRPMSALYIRLLNPPKRPSASLPQHVESHKKQSSLTMRPYGNGQEYCQTVSNWGYFNGRASWYVPRNRLNGESYDMYAMTAAHKTLPMNTVVRVTNQETKAQTIVRINDRGPFVESRIIDLSYTAANEIGIIQKGGSGELEILGLNRAVCAPSIWPVCPKGRNNRF
jgi:rare lipoprotein A